jgi:membrane-associated phospholipid phosphatase
LKDVNHQVTLLGEGVASLLVFSGFAGYGLIADDDKAKETALLGIESFVTSGLMVQLFKHTFGRERPSAATTEGGYWHGPLTAYDAFPSGHASTAFAMATVIAEQYNDSPVVPIVCYSLATAVGFSRLTENAHWLSDVFVGGAIGYLCGKLALSHRSSKSHSAPSAGDVRVGVTYRYGIPMGQISVHF